MHAQLSPVDMLDTISVLGEEPKSKVALQPTGRIVQR